MAASALLIDAFFSGAGLVPASRPSRAAVFGSVSLDYRLILDVIALLAFAVLFAITARRGARDPVCGMRVERSRALTLARDGTTIYFCSPGCRDAYASSRAR
jgi:YHS domain-containing protein